MHDRGRSLVLREYQSISNDYVFSSPSCEYHYLGDVVRREGFAATTTATVRDADKRGVGGRYGVTYAYTASAFDLSP